MNTDARHFLRLQNHTRARSTAGIALHTFGPAAERYVLNILAALPLRRLGATWASQLFASEGITKILRQVIPPLKRSRRAAPQTQNTEQAFERVISAIESRVIRPRVPLAPGQPVARNIVALAKMAGLDKLELAVLRFLFTMHSAEPLDHLCESLGEVSLPSAATVIASAIRESPEAVIRALGSKGRLAAGGLLRIPTGLQTLDEKFRLALELLDLIHRAPLTRQDVVSRFLTTATPPTLNWDDFTHLHNEAGSARDVLRAAVKQKRAGINVLFHGETGTGKSELSRLIAQEIGAPLYIVGRTDEEGLSPEAYERLSALRLGNRVLGDGASLLMFDELEDIFAWGNAELVAGRGALQGSKQWLNDLLETNPVPTIWITNKADIDPAFLRRFACVVEFRELGQRQRGRVLERHLGKGTALTASEIDSIAQQFHSSPAQIGSAVAIAKMLAPNGEVDRASIERILAPIEKLVTGVDPLRRPVFDPSSFRLDALNASTDLVALADRLADWKPDSRVGVSICLYGRPGTGKSEFAKYLAYRMGRPLMLVRASDLLDCFVGGTEQRIAAAFRAAEGDDAILLLDEVDSLLRDRQLSQRSWEVTQVNELLQQLESFRGVVVCTTNLWNNLDEAALRRFIHKIEFRYLRPTQALTLFRSMFGHCWPLDDALTRRLSSLTQLAPGDFAVVARQARISAQPLSAATIVAALEAEVRVKPGARNAAGFAPQLSNGDAQRMRGAT